jgi:hypothetical protein
VHPRLLAAAAGLTGLLAAAPAAPARDERIRIPEVAASLSGRDVRVEARLSRPLPEDVLKRLASGLPTTARWEVRLFVSRRKWWDDLKDERRYEVTATYRPVSGDFAVERRLDGRLLETALVPARSEAAQALATLPRLPCFTVGRALAGRPLAVRVRCLYGTGIALGLFPTRIGTSWRRSPLFTLTEPRESP